MPDQPQRREENPFLAPLDSPSAEDRNSLSGKRLGAWQIVAKIGHGGMGAVYSAVRADRVFEKRVALKVVKRGIDTDAVLERFDHERRILASLDHPYIARLLDGGTSSDGRPWFVMEFVEGQPIDQFCREQHLTVPDRCRLFRKVCESVEYAHRNLVIHRDLKPANILVSAGGSPKLLDFGIARLLSVDPGDDTLPRGTGPDSALTPNYASPEQQRGEPVNTATDVYSLGAVLYEILAEQRPAALRNSAGGRVIGKPSEAAQGKALRARLAGDLDNIVLKATHPDPLRRYSSVDELSEDLNCYLKGLPVTAREDSFTYRLHKFLGRHRFGAIASLALLCGLVAGVIAMLWEARQADQQRQRAEQSLGQMVTMANHTLFDVHGAIERLPGALDARKRLVGETMRYLDQLAVESGDDPRLRLALAAGYARVAELKGAPPGQPSLGDWPGALDAYRKAASILDGMLARDPGDTVLLLRRAEVSREMGSALIVTETPARSADESARGLQAAAKVLAREPANREARKLAALLQLNALSVLTEQDPEAARQQLLSALPGFEKLAAGNPSDPDALMPLAQAQGFLGVIAVIEDRTGEELPYYRRAAELFERVLSLRPRDVVAQRALLMQYSHLVPSVGDRNLAIEYARKEQAIAQSLHAADPSSQIAVIDLAGSYLRLASALPDSRNEEALGLLDQSFNLIQTVAVTAPYIPRLALALSAIDEQRAGIFKRLHRYPQALSYYRRSRDRLESVTLKKSVTSIDKYRVEIEGEIGAVLALLGERNEAIATVDGMLTDAQRLGAAWHSAIPRSLSWAGDAFAELAAHPGPRAQRRSDWSRAAVYYSSALHEWSKLPPTTETARLTAALTRCRKALQP